MGRPGALGALILAGLALAAPALARQLVEDHAMFGEVVAKAGIRPE